MEEAERSWTRPAASRLPTSTKEALEKLEQAKKKLKNCCASSARGIERLLAKLRNAAARCCACRAGLRRSPWSTATSPSAARACLPDGAQVIMAKLNTALEVAVAVVPKNPLMVSVDYPTTARNFCCRSSKDGSWSLAEGPKPSPRRRSRTSSGTCQFLTHHPFLQTEVLANQIAQSLVPVLQVWCRSRQKNDGRRQEHRGRSLPVRRRLTLRCG